MYKPIVVNKRKTWSLITVFLIFIIGLGWLFSRVYPEYSFILPVAVIFSVISSWISYFYSDKIVLAISRAKEIKKQDNPYLYRMVENLCITSGLPAPRVYIIDDTAMNAFATGRDPKHATVAFTKGIIDRLENEELEGVVAHELSHIGNRDMLVSTVVVVLVGVVQLLSDIFLRSIWWRGRNDREGQASAIFLLVGIVLAILAPIAGILIQLAVSRKREFLADASGALLTRNPDGLADALLKIFKDKEPLEVANKATAHLYIVNPFKNPHKLVGTFANLFNTHPPIEQRVKALRAMQ